MKVSELRRVMNDEAGVFFDRNDVVEKQDMINIFVASGRLTVLPEEEERAGAGAGAALDDDDAFTAAPVDGHDTKLEVQVDQQKPPPLKSSSAPVVETVLPTAGGNPSEGRGIPWQRSFTGNFRL